ncbi:MAG: 3-oxoacyl-ACP reductase FabG [Actinomycetaceae bacterium]|nr:3-oxoacyl-ACP reductase FabG [Actinomycetaceae bacterium]
MTPRNILITGAARGIGLDIAWRLAGPATRVIIADINGEAAKSAAMALQNERFSAAALEVNIADPDSIDAAKKWVIEEYGGIDVLVNNAGIVSNTHWSETSLEEWQRVLSINLTGTMLMSQAFLPGMCDAGYGRVINIVSLAGRNGGVSVGPAYAASKAGIIGLTRHLAGKVAGSGVTVNAVAPGTTRTEMAEQFTPEQMDVIHAAIPMGRLGEPSEIAAAVAYFASEESGFTTGVIMDVNGGMYFG